MSTPKSPSDNQIIRTLMEASELRRKENIEGFEKLAASIDALAIEIAQLTAQQKATAQNLDKLGEKIDRGFDRCIEAIQEQNKSINRCIEAIQEQNKAINGHLAVAQAQSVNIAELTKLLTMMIAAK